MKDTEDQTKKEVNKKEVLKGVWEGEKRRRKRGMRWSR